MRRIHFVIKAWKHEFGILLFIVWQQRCEFWAWVFRYEISSANLACKVVSPDKSHNDHGEICNSKEADGNRLNWISLWICRIKRSSRKNSINEKNALYNDPEQQHFLVSHCLINILVPSRINQGLNVICLYI